MVMSDRAQFDLAVRLRQKRGRRDRRGIRLRQRAVLQRQAGVRAGICAASGAGPAADRQRRARDYADGGAARGRDGRHHARAAGVCRRRHRGRTIRAIASRLLASARALDEEIGPECEVVLLGSIASAKYVDVLTDVFGERLLFPIDFVGRGDMSRGGLLAAVRPLRRRADVCAGDWGCAPWSSPTQASADQRNHDRLQDFTPAETVIPSFGCWLLAAGCWPLRVLAPIPAARSRKPTAVHIALRIATGSVWSASPIKDPRRLAGARRDAI